MKKGLCAFGSYREKSSALEKLTLGERFIINEAFRWSVGKSQMELPLKKRFLTFEDNVHKPLDCILQRVIKILVIRGKEAGYELVDF